MEEEHISADTCKSLFHKINDYFYEKSKKDEINFSIHTPFFVSIIEKPECINRDFRTISLFNNIKRTFLILEESEKHNELIDLSTEDDFKSYILDLYTNLIEDNSFFSIYEKKAFLFQQLFNFELSKKINKKSSQAVDIKQNIENILSQNKTTTDQISNLEKSINEIKQIETKKERAEISNLLKYLKAAKEKTDILVGNIADNKNAGKYKEYYESCKKSARRLFWSSLLIMAVVSGIVVCHLWNIDTIDTTKILIRFPLAFLVLMPSFFMMRESKKLKDKEFQYHDMMCRIITSAPYIDGLINLDERQKDQMKADLVKDFFARPIECRDDGGLVPADEICKIVKACVGEKQ